MTIVIMDTCCLINLYAAGNPASLLAPLGWEIYVSRQVLEESLYLLREDSESEARFVRERIDVQPAIDGGALRLCDVAEGDEMDLFVQLAATLDEGEAACLAIARSRGWLLATDDRKAIRLAGGLQVETITTPELIKHWADATQARDVEVAAVLKKVQAFARFVPRRASPLYDWWTRVIDQSLQ